MLTPDHLVGGGVRRYGRFAQRFRDTNPLDAYRGIARLWHRWRLKEWVGFTLIHPQLSGAMIMQDAKYLASSELFVRDRSTGGAAEKAVTLRGGGVTLPDELLHGGTCTVAKRGYLLRYDFDERAGTGTVQFDCAADASGPAISGTLTLHLREAAPALSISAKITPASTTTRSNSRSRYRARSPSASTGTGSTRNAISRSSTRTAPISLFDLLDLGHVRHPGGRWHRRVQFRRPRRVQ